MVDKPTIVVLGFETTYERSYDKDGKPTGRKDRAVDWVNYAPAHLALFQQTKERVAFMDPANMRQVTDDENGSKKVDFMRWRWAQIEPAYKAWKQGHEIPVDGTPLGSWPGLNMAQANVLRALGIKSVEQVATMPEAIMGRVQLPGVREIKHQAETFLAAQGDAQFAERMTSLEANNKQLQEQLEAAMELLKDQASAKKPKKEAA